MIVEVKCARAISIAHIRQVVGYLRLSGLKVGLLLNFGAGSMKNGIRRIVNDF